MAITINATAVVIPFQMNGFYNYALDTPFPSFVVIPFQMNGFYNQ